MIRLRNIAWIVGACLLCCYALFGSAAWAMEYNIPHVTGGQSNWTDELIVDNMGDATEDFWVVLYNAGGGEGLRRKFTIPALETMTIRLKDYAPNANCGTVITTNTVTPLNGVVYLRFRLRFTSSAQGIAEFELSTMNKSQLAFNFSEQAAIEWKGLAVMNTDPTTAAATQFYAIYNNGTLSQPVSVVINPNCRLVGFYSTWFPAIPLADIQSVIVSSVSSSLCGVCISGSNNNAKLLFTPAGDATRFRETAINTRFMVDTKLLEGNWVFNVDWGTAIYTYSYHFNRLSGATNAETGYLINGVNGYNEVLTCAEYLPTTGDFSVIETSTREVPGVTYRREYTFDLDAPSTECDFWSITGGAVTEYRNGAFNGTTTFDGIQVSPIINNNPDVDE